MHLQSVSVGKAWTVAAACGLILMLGAVRPASVSAADADSVKQVDADAGPLLSVLTRHPLAQRLVQLWKGEAEDGDDAVALSPGAERIYRLVERGNLFDVFHEGGPIMWPLLCASMLGLSTVLERVGFFALERRRRDAAGLRRFMLAVRDGDMEQAFRLGKRSRYFVVRALGYALVHRHHALDGAVRFAKEQELHRYRRGIPILDTVITLAPLLGLLGTVTGMMASFSLIGGELGAPGAITGGIAEALIATAFGLGIAITSLIPFNLMNQRLEEATTEIDEAASAMTTLLSGSHAASLPGNNGEAGDGACLGA